MLATDTRQGVLIAATEHCSVTAINMTRKRNEPYTLKR